VKIFNKKKDKNLLRKVLFFLLIVGSLNFFLIANTNGFSRDIYNSLLVHLNLPFLVNKDLSEISLKKDLKTIFKNISSGFLHIFEEDKFEKISLDVSFVNFQKIVDDRASALTQEKDRQFLSKKTKVDAKLSYKNKIYPVTIRIKGDRADHYAASSRISLDVEFVGDNSIFGFQRFSLQNHVSRQFPENEVISNFLTTQGIITPQFKTIILSVNGDNWGQMYLEESISSSFFENRRLKETPVARFTNQENQIIASKFKKNYNLQDIENFFDQYGKFETRVYKEEKYKKDILSNSMISTMRLIHDNLNSIDLENIEASKNLVIDKIDLEKFSKLLALSSVINSWHATTYTNLKFYFNPYTGLIEPMPSDFILNNEVYKDIRHFKKNFLIETNNFYYDILNNKKFIESYFNFVENISSNINFFNENIKKLCNDFNVVDCGSNFNSHILETNSRFILAHRKEIEQFFKKKKDEIVNEKFNFLKVVSSNKLKNNEKFLDLTRAKLDNYIYSRAFSDGSFFIKNISPFEIYIKDIKIKFNEKRDGVFENLDSNVNLLCKENISINKKITSKFFLKIDLNLQKELKKCFENASIIEINFYENSKLLTVKADIENSVFKEFKKIDSLENIKNFVEGKDVILKTGTYFFDKPLILPNGYSLIVEKGAKLLFSKNSYIYIDGGNIQINGTKLEPVSLISKENNSSWKGLHVKNSQKSKISYAHFHNLNNFYSEELLIFLTGAINFYKSEVQIEYSQFTNSFCEDFINLIHSKFDIKNITIKNSKSDAIDLDFSDGNFDNISFSNIGGDAVDLSGSKVIIRNMNAIKIGDKAISVGESSSLYVENSRFSESKFGIAVKDGSKLRSKNLEFSNNKHDLASYIKKSFYLNTNETYIETTSKNLKILKDSAGKMYVNDKLININNFKTNELE
jgi:hypothetical protein